MGRRAFAKPDSFPVPALPVPNNHSDHEAISEFGDTLWMFRRRANEMRLLATSLLFSLCFLSSIAEVQGRANDSPWIKATPATLLKLVAQMRSLFPPELAVAVIDEMNKDVKEAWTEFGHGKFPAMLNPAERFYKKIDAGEFNGAPSVTWNGYDREHDRPTFIYSESSFAYITASRRRIKPRTMDTDGGSIPKALHSVGNFTPWTYAPAYIIHDWLFVAHRCGSAPDNDIDFETSALLLAESIKTLMEVGFVTTDGKRTTLPKDQDTLYLVYLAVKSPVARKLWDKKADTSECPQPYGALTNSTAGAGGVH